MKKILACLSAVLFVFSANAATLLPIQLLNPAGSTSGQAIVSTGATTAPAWGNVSTTALTGAVAIANGGTGQATQTAALTAILGASAIPVANGGTGATTNTGTGASVLNGSPALTGTPTAPTASVGTNTTQLSTTAFVQAQAFGSIQTFTNVTVSRVSGTTYTNSTAKPIVVYVNGLTTAANGFFSVTVAGVNASFVSQSVSSSALGVSIVVPPGLTYSVTTGSATISTWYEYR